MQAKHFQYYIHHPNELKAEHVKELQQLVKDFPYFQAAHVLLCLASKKWDASVYQQSLKKTAITVSNRSHLFKLIHRLEHEEENRSVNTVPEIKSDAELNSVNNAQNELTILKETEELIEAPGTEISQAKIETEAAEQMLEKEIQNKVVTSFVEKEILKTPEIQKPAQFTASPENFTEWLALMKKNNGGSLSISLPSETELSPEENQRGADSSLIEKNAQNSLKNEENDALEARKQKNRAIIDKIIEKSPGLIRQKEDQKFFTADIKAKESLIENEHLVTETLAKIYALQGNINKAIRAYEILSLKYPQKSAYFAALILKLKNN